MFPFLLSFFLYVIFWSSFLSTTIILNSLFPSLHLYQSFSLSLSHYFYLDISLLPLFSLSFSFSLSALITFPRSLFPISAILFFSFMYINLFLLYLLIYPLSFLPFLFVPIFLFITYSPSLILPFPYDERKREREREWVRLLYRSADSRRCCWCCQPSCRHNSCQEEEAVVSSRDSCHCKLSYNSLVRCSLQQWCDVWRGEGREVERAWGEDPGGGDW